MNDVGLGNCFPEFWNGTTPMDRPSQSGSCWQPSPPYLDPVHDFIGWKFFLRPRSNYGYVTSSSYESTAKIVNVTLQSSYFWREIDRVHYHIHGVIQSDVKRTLPVRSDTRMSTILSAAFPSPYGLSSNPGVST